MTKSFADKMIRSNKNVVEQLCNLCFHFTKTMLYIHQLMITEMFHGLKVALSATKENGI